MKRADGRPLGAVAGPRNESQRMKRGGRMLWQIGRTIPNIDARVCGLGPRFTSRYRGVCRIITKVVIDIDGA